MADHANAAAGEDTKNSLVPGPAEALAPSQESAVSCGH